MLLMLLLVAPLIQKKFPFISEVPLYGAFYPIEKEELNLENWQNGNFQNNFAARFDNGLGFRNSFIRVRNQYLFSLFQTSESYASVGKQGQLFSYDYYESFQGFDFLGVDSIAKTYEQLLKLKEQLDSLEKPMLLVIAPNKVRLYKDLLANTQESTPSGTTNYDVWKNLLNQNQIPFIDCNSWFQQMSDTAQYATFPNTGIHWNSYAMSLVLDSIVKRFDAMSTRDTLLRLSWQGITVKDSTIESDRDLINGLNLFSTVSTTPQAFPDIKVESKGLKSKPNALVIGDSFFWGFFALNPLFNEYWHPASRFWYYNNTQMDMGQGSQDSVVNLNAHETLQRMDYVLILATESNLDIMPFGFAEKFLNEAVKP